jgi:hypothetical protein
VFAVTRPPAQDSLGRPAPGRDFEPPAPGTDDGIGMPSPEVGGSGGRGLDAVEAYLDPVGAADRANARTELAGKFVVIEDGFAGTRLPNMVTAEEYDQLARTYSDVRLGRSDLKIDASTSKDPDQYRADMMDDIGDIMQTESGRAMVAQLASNTHGVDADGNAIHHTTTLHPLLDGAGDANAGGAIEIGDAQQGVGSPYADGTRGDGDDLVDIYANPNLDVVSAGATFRSDVALYHEMVHALHDTTGTTDFSAVDAGDGVDPGVTADIAAHVNRQEHLGAGLGIHAHDRFSENRYRAERNAVARSGKGLAGDRTMPQRDEYAAYQGTYDHEDRSR